jgi:hypothetical protein
MKRNTRRRNLEPMYAPTYTENGSFIKIPAVAGTSVVVGSNSIRSVTFANIRSSLGYATDAAFWAVYSGFKLTAVTFKIPGATATTAWPVNSTTLTFFSGKIHVLTDILKSARVKPHQSSPEGLWQAENGQLTTAPSQPYFQVTVPSNANAMQNSVVYVEISLRLR